jgi:aminopeptidase-like protein
LKTEFRMSGSILLGWAKDLFPICRSITGPGIRETLYYIQKLLPELLIQSIPSGTQVFDWTVPDEWIIREAFITDESGEKIIDYNNHSLHVMGYSVPVDKWMTLEELDPHLCSLPDQPNAIPYITSYYSRNWGFCLTHHQREKLKYARYHVVIDSEIKPGVLNYGELILPGESKQEVFLSTYICHPSMANNELSGPVVMIALAQWLASLEKRRYTYRIVFIPETIGSIVYLSRNIDYLKKQVIAGFNISCVGDDRCYSYLPSRDGNTISDKVALHVLKYTDPNFKRYTWLDRGSDERQYCAPRIDLPIASVLRSKYYEYPEYHTSLDDLDFISENGLEGSFKIYCKIINILENNTCLVVKMFCEPFLSKHGLYPNCDNNIKFDDIENLFDFISYCDGNLSILDICNILDISYFEIENEIKLLVEKDILCDVNYYS